MMPDDALHVQRQASQNSGFSASCKLVRKSRNISSQSQKPAAALIIKTVDTHIYGPPCIDAALHYV